MSQIQYGNPDVLCQRMVEAKKVGEDLVVWYSLFFLFSHFCQHVLYIVLSFLSKMLMPNIIGKKYNSLCRKLMPNISNWAMLHTIA
jgi:hypothetical protein